MVAVGKNHNEGSNRGGSAAPTHVRRPKPRVERSVASNRPDRERTETDIAGYLSSSELKPPK